MKKLFFITTLLIAVILGLNVEMFAQQESDKKSKQSAEAQSKKPSWREEVRADIESYNPARLDTQEALRDGFGSSKYDTEYYPGKDLELSRALGRRAEIKKYALIGIPIVLLVLLVVLLLHRSSLRRKQHIKESKPLSRQTSSNLYHKPKNVSDEIGKLARLRDKGEISDEEFESQIRDLL